MLLLPCLVVIELVPKLRLGYTVFIVQVFAYFVAYFFFAAGHSVSIEYFVLREQRSGTS